MAETSSGTSPIVAIAAVSVIIFSAVGVGVMTGVIPSSLSKTEEQPVKSEAAPATTQAASPAAAPAEKPKAAAPTPRKQQTADRAQEPTRTAMACTNCGSVISVTLVKHQGEGSGLGAIGGAVVGGVLGHQVGSGRGRDVATVAGAGAGAYAGHQIEKNVKTTQDYVVGVRMDDGSTRNFPYQSEPAFRVGDKIQVIEGKLVAR